MASNQRAGSIPAHAGRLVTPRPAPLPLVHVLLGVCIGIWLMALLLLVAGVGL